MSIPRNITAGSVNNSNWVLWDEVPETIEGKVAWYELHRGDSPTTLSHYRTVTAASPGFIDEHVNSVHYYRVRAVSTQGNPSNWSNIVRSGVQPLPPTASFIASALSGEAPLDVTFDASSSSDQDGILTSYRELGSNLRYCVI